MGLFDDYTDLEKWGVSSGLGGLGAGLGSLFGGGHKEDPMLRKEGSIQGGKGKELASCLTTRTIQRGGRFLNWMRRQKCTRRGKGGGRAHQLRLASTGCAGILRGQQSWNSGRWF